MEMRKPIQVSEAIERILQFQHQGTTEYVSINDCDNRRLGEDIIAEEPVPSFDKSPYDGFAFNSEDTNGAGRNNPVQFMVVEHIGAGQVPVVKLEKGQATRIMTGAKIPEGADCVAMFEICQTFEDNDQNFMTIKRQIKAGQNIIEKGSEVTRGTKLVDRGKLINPGVKALLATFGHSEVCVAKRPVVGVVATGTELLDVDQELQPGKIRNSNAYMIESQIIRAGAECKYFGKMEDEFEPSYELIRNALSEVDMLITTGGVSVGDFDLMPAIYEKLGADVLFNKVAMRPGSVTTVANCDGKMMFGLSGNPSACYVGFELFTRPVIQESLFNPRPFHKRINAVLGVDFPKPNPFTRFVRCYTTYEGTQIQAQLAGIDKSNVVTSLAHSTGLMVLPGGTRGFTTGDEVDVLLLEDHDGQREFQHVKRRD